VPSSKPPPSDEQTDFRPEVGQPDSDNDDHIDELIVTPLDRSTQTTIRGPFPIYQTGFHWRTTVDATPITMTFTGRDAVAVRDGSVVARGIVDTISRSSDGRSVTLYVRPPK